MTNEELFQKAYQGQTEAIEELFKQNEKIICRLCRRYQNKRFSFDDLYQESYIALLKAIKGYQSESGNKFITYLANSIKWHFLRLFRYDTDRDILYILDSPIDIDGDSDTTYLDMVADDTVAVADDALDDLIYSEMLENIKQILLEQSHRMWEIIRKYYIEKKSLSEIADEMDISWQRVAQIKRKAISVLRRPEKWRRYRDIYQNDVIAESISRTGRAYFTNSGTSGTEWAAIKLMG